MADDQPYRAPGQQAPDQQDDAQATTLLRRHRGPDPVALLVGLLTLGMALAAFVGQVPDLSGLDPRWIFAGIAGLVGLLLLVGSVRRPRN